MSAAFAHHMSPEIAVDALRGYRRDFTPRHDGDQPYSVMSVINFASEDDEALLEFEAAWTLTMANLRRGVREPLRPEQVTDYARSSAFRDMPRDSGRMVAASPKVVAERLLELKEQAQADEIVRSRRAWTGGCGGRATAPSPRPGAGRLSAAHPVLTITHSTCPPLPLGPGA